MDKKLSHPITSTWPSVICFCSIYTTLDQRTFNSIMYNGAQVITQLKISSFRRELVMMSVTVSPRETTCDASCPDWRTSRNEAVSALLTATNFKKKAENDSTTITSHVNDDDDYIYFAWLTHKMNHWVKKKWKFCGNVAKMHLRVLLPSTLLT